MAIRAEHNVNFDQHYAFYLLYTISYYLTLYIKQNRLHPQVNWLINTWLGALQNLSLPQPTFQGTLFSQNENHSKSENTKKFQ